MRKKLLIICILLLFSTLTFAQGVISYGSSTVSTLSAEAPIAIYTFVGATGDQVTVQAIAIAPGLDLSVTLQSGTAILDTNSNDPYSPGSADARIDANLPTAGAYIILVSSTNGATGDFLLRLSGQAAASKTIVTGSPTDIPIALGETSYYSFDGNPDAATTVNLVATPPDFEFIAILRNSAGQIVGTTSGSSATMNVPAGNESYEIEISSADPTMEGVVTVTLGQVGEAPPAQPQPTATAPAQQPTEEAPAPQVTEEVGADDTCQATGGGFPNIRTAPSTNDLVLAQVQPNVAYDVTGVYSNWYQINVPGLGIGWVRNDVVNISGNCTTVPAVVPPDTAPAPTQAPNQQAATPTYTPSYTPTTQNNVAPTATFTPSYTPTTQNVAPTVTYTPSYTPTEPPPPQIAPEDARFNNPLNIPLDNTASVLDFVSYSGGDTEDRVRWDITGMNQNSSISGGQARLVISATCFGEGTNNITFFTGGNTYSCGATIVDTDVTFNSKTGSVVITATGGEGTYVQWVLTGTATRTN